MALLSIQAHNEVTSRSKVEEHPVNALTEKTQQATRVLNNVRRLRTPEFSWDDARDTLDCIQWNGLEGADRSGIFRKTFFGIHLKLRDVATAVGLLFRGEPLYVRTPQGRFEKVRDLRDLRAIYSLWGHGASVTSKKSRKTQEAISAVA
jgi:hypothetical protein